MRLNPLVTFSGLMKHYIDDVKVRRLNSCLGCLSGSVSGATGSGARVPGDDRASSSQRRWGFFEGCFMQLVKKKKKKPKTWISMSNSHFHSRPMSATGAWICQICISGVSTEANLFKWGWLCLDACFSPSLCGMRTAEELQMGCGPEWDMRCI